MKKEELISIIIPVYNVEPFIRQSLESVIHQTYSNLEIILVDDGSQDASGKVCDEYKRKDKRIQVIHKENGGLSSARNVGMDYATGKYMMFLDSDDFLEENSCQILYDAIQEKNVDYVIGNYIYTTHTGEKYEKPMFDMDHNFEVTLTDYKKSFFVMNSIVCNKLFETNSIKKHSLKFVEGALAEDAIFTSFYYTHTPKGYFIKDVIYNYRQNGENASISTNCNMRYFCKLKEAYERIYDNYKTTNHLEFYRFFTARIMPWFLCKIIDSNQLKGKEECLEVLKMFQWYFKQKEEYKIEILEKRLCEIIDTINKGELEEAVDKIEKTAEDRRKMRKEEKEKMYAVTDELYEKMIEDKKEEKK